MIVKDDAAFLEHCLDSVKEIVDEVIVVDTGSKDATKDIAAKAGAQLFDLEWKDDFSAARNFSLGKAGSNWILVLDAVEMLDAAGREEVLRLVNSREHCMKDMVGFRLVRRSYTPKSGSAAMSVDEVSLSRDFSHHTDTKTVRLFKNHDKIRFRNRVDELVDSTINDNHGEIIDAEVVVHDFSLLKGGSAVAKAGPSADDLWRMLQAEPENPRHNRDIAMAFMERGRNDLALKYLTRALRFDPKFPGIYADIGRVFVKMGQPIRAINYFNMAIAQDKKDISSLNNLAVIYMSMGKYEPAQKLLDAAMIREPKNPAVLKNMSILKDRMKKEKR
jgi:glycosyltransferase involved in cell wall biosynthesis